MTTAQHPKVYLYQQIVQAKLFIDDHYASKINIDSISGEACFSKFHFIRLFKKTYGKTPHQYLSFVRIEKATELLRNGHVVSDVCHAVGFESLSSFGSLFKRIVGATPSAFLLEQQQMKTAILNTPLKFIPGCFIYQNGWNKK